MTIARIDGGTVAETREITLDTVPAHKRWAWKTIVEEKPGFSRKTQQLVGPEVTIEQDRVVKRWTVVQKSREDVVAAIKSEARRRITERYPEWKQSNMTAAGVELQDSWRRNGLWTAEEQSYASELDAAWAWIKAVRAASDAIEALDPTPPDFDADNRWPE